MRYARGCIVSLVSTGGRFADSLEVEQFRNLIYRNRPRLWTQAYQCRKMPDTPMQFSQ